MYYFDIEFSLLSSFIEPKSQKHSYFQLHALGQPFYYHMGAEFNQGLINSTRRGHATPFNSDLNTVPYVVRG